MARKHERTSHGIEVLLVDPSALCHHCTHVATGQQLCDTCSNPTNKSPVKNLDFVDVGVCSSLKLRLREMF